MTLDDWSTSPKANLITTGDYLKIWFSRVFKDRTDYPSLKEVIQLSEKACKNSEYGVWLVQRVARSDSRRSPSIFAILLDESLSFEVRKAAVDSIPHLTILLLRLLESFDYQSIHLI